jgi:Ca2+-binding EF-hand superfamily protein
MANKSDIELRNFFTQIDKDGDNLIDFNDFKTLLKGLDNRLTDRDILEVLSVSDADEDGALNYEEFVHFLRAEKVKDHEDDLEYSISELQM